MAPKRTMLFLVAPVNRMYAGKDVQDKNIDMPIHTSG